MADTSHWILIFPPLVHSNWGSYYPSTAVLSAALEAEGVSALQSDLNADFLDYLIRHDHLAAAEKGQHLAIGAGLSETDYRAASLARASAAQLLQRNVFSVTDSEGRHLPSDGQASYSAALELARPFHVDEPVSYLVSEDFANSDVAGAYKTFFEACDLARRLEAVEHGVGISVPMGPQLGPSILLARHIRSLAPGLRIVLGGPTLTLMAPESLNELLSEAREIDAVVRHEGEVPICALASQCLNGVWTPERVPQVATSYRTPDSDGKGFRLANSVAALYADDIMQRLVAPRLGLQQARGCYWGKCAYCDFVELFNTGLRYDGRSVANVLDEMRQQRAQHGVRDFWLITEALPPGVAHKFAQMIVDDGMDVDWRSFVMVDPGYTEDTLRLMRLSGCSSLTVGLESMTTRALHNVQKRAGREENLAFLEAVQAAGLQIDVNLIPDLPTTTAEEAMDGLAALEPFAESFRRVAVFPFEATHSSVVGRDPEKYGLSPVAVAEYEDPVFPRGQAQYADNRITFVDRAMTPKERSDVLAAYLRFARRINCRASDSLPKTGERSSSGPFELRSDAIAVICEGPQAIVYDWPRDRYWDFPSVFGDLVTWMRDRPGAAYRRDIATFLRDRGAVPMPLIPEISAAMLDALIETDLVRVASAQKRACQ